jgi:crotonobetainyl-CoA:carnitine CoA-transferase CaiB-like acyl-CoA transferase
MRWYVTKHNETRHGQLWEWSGRPLVRYVWTCKDGSVCFAITGGARFGQSQRAIIEWMDSEGVASDYLKQIDWSSVDWGSITQEIRDSFEGPVSNFFKQKTKAEIFEESIKRGIVLFPANTAKEILEDSQLKARDYWIEVEHPDLGITITYPGAFFKSSETSWKMKRIAPRIGEHNEDIYNNELGLSKDQIIILKQNNII